MRTLQRFVGAFAASVALALAVAGTALAAAPVNEIKNHRFTATFVDTELCPGLAVEVTFDIKRTWTNFYDREGNLVRFVAHAQYSATFTNPANGVTLSSPGSRHIVEDYVRGTYSDTGVYRNVVAPGEGTVLQQTGRWLETLAFDGTILAINGPHEEWSGETEAFCAALAG